MSLRVAVVGAAGRMGSRVLAAVAADPDMELVAAIGRAESPRIGTDVGEMAGLGALGVPLSPPADGVFGDADVVIDFSLPAGLRGCLPWLDGRALVTGVTGLDDATLAALGQASERSAILRADNFSTGVHVLGDAVFRAARAMPKADIEIVEIHHRHKRDSPSGTARFLAEQAELGRGIELPHVHGRGGTQLSRSDEIAFHSLRCGDVVGEHTVWLASRGERLQLGHVATTRDTFVYGALRAARWIVGKPPGAYPMRDMLGL